MSYTKLEKIFEKLKKNTLSIARKTYDYNMHDDLHDFYYYTNWKDQKFSIWIDVTDPRPGRSGFACWKVREEVFVDADGNKTYKMKFPLSCAINTEEKRQEFVRRQFKKAKKQETKEILETLE